MTKRPNLSNLADRLAKGTTGTTEADQAQPDLDAPKGRTLAGAPRQRRPKGEGDSTDPRKSALVRLAPDTWKRMKLLALDGDTTMQDLLETAVAEFLERRGG